MRRRDPLCFIAPAPNLILGPDGESPSLPRMAEFGLDLVIIGIYFAVIIGIVFLKERPGPVRLAAVALAAAGIALLKLGA